MKIAILGSGIQGVFSAWWLAQAGHEVFVVDRCNGPALETSFANGGQISIAYSEPLASTHLIYDIFKSIFRYDYPLKFYPHFDRYQWLWGFKFLRECLPWNFLPNITAMIRMTEYSQKILKIMQNELNINYHCLKYGVLNFYRNKKEFEHAKKIVNLMNDLGVNRKILTADETVKIEPALFQLSNFIKGGDYTPEDESGDAYIFTCELAKKCQEIGVKFFYQTTINRLLTELDRIKSVELIRPDGYYETLSADIYVVALGSYSPFILRPLGIQCNIYPIKGYSATLEIINPDLAPSVSITDTHNRMVLSRIGNKLRFATSAELSGYSRNLNESRCKRLTQIAQELFPEALNFEKIMYWSGLRPSTPSGIPLIGRTKFKNLFMNTGHGSLGWTMGAGSSRALADIIEGVCPEPEFPFISL
ncbi:MAG: D-amino acid dehydrogenase [Bordetella sp.]|nr:MAG: D-amino acid dehydrogenase [Bordetella sp.]